MFESITKMLNAAINYRQKNSRRFFFNEKIHGSGLTNQILNSLGHPTTTQISLSVYLRPKKKKG